MGDTRLELDRASQRLITSVGARRDYQVVRYGMGGGTAETRFAFLAVAKLKGLAGARVDVLVTEEARRTWWDILEPELVAAGLHPEAVPILPGRSEDEIFSVFRTITERVQPGEGVVLDVTFSLRHLPFVYLAALAYLVGLRGARLAGMYYGAHELKSEDGVAPIIDITPLFGLIEWYHALQTARRTGDLRALAQQIEGDVGRMFQTGRGDPHLSHVKDAVRKLARSLALGLPLEIGLDAAALAQAVRQVLIPTAEAGQAATLALTALADDLESWSAFGASTKGQMVPSRDELARQLRLVEWYVARDEFPKALLILREWLVSAVVVARCKPWLDRDSREEAQGWLNAVVFRCRKGLAGDLERDLGALWSAVTERRNRIAHAGMTKDEVSLSTVHIPAIVERCRALLDADLTTVPGRGHGSTRLLVTSLGRSPGVVYTAVRRVTPDRLVVVTSAEARPGLEDALEHAGASQVERRLVELVDPHAGYSQVYGFLDDWLCQWLVEAGEVVANVTGGTSAMQFAVERIADEAHALGVPVRRIALVDRRSHGEQQEDPYVLGQVLELTVRSPAGQKGGGAADDRA